MKRTLKAWAAVNVAGARFGRRDYRAYGMPFLPVSFARGKAMDHALTSKTPMRVVRVELTWDDAK